MTLRCAQLLLLLALAVSCRQENVCGDSDAGQPVDSNLMAFLSRTRSAHHLADQAEASQDRMKAISALKSVTDGPLPSGAGRDAPEVREVLSDTLARLADLESQEQDYSAADSSLLRGLQLVPTRTYFRGHLYEVQGLVEERRAKNLQARGETDAASRARARALDALETAMKIQAEVIEKSARPKP